MASLEDSFLVWRLRFCQIKRVCISGVRNAYRGNKLKTNYCWVDGGADNLSLASNYVLGHKLHILLSIPILYPLVMSTIDMDVGFLGLDYIALLKHSYSLGNMSIHIMLNY